MAMLAVASVFLFLLVVGATSQSLSSHLQTDLLRYGGFIENAYSEDGTKVSNASQIEAKGYHITKYLYCNADMGQDEASLMGFISGSSSNNEIVVVFRGSKTLEDWIRDIMVDKADFPYMGGSPVPKVHSGILSLYTETTRYGSLREQITSGLQEMYNSTKHTNIILTGHSLGGALAILCAADLINKDLGISSSQLQVYAFGSPMPGDVTFKTMTGGLSITRVADIRDLVPYLPAMDYVHTGVPLIIDGCRFGTTTSTGIRKIIGYHMMSRYIHTIYSLSSNSRNVKISCSKEVSLNAVGHLPRDILELLLSIFKTLKYLFKNLATLEDFIVNFDKPCQ